LRWGTLSADMTLRIFVEAPLAAGSEFELPPGPARHVQVRRLQPGDALRLFDGRGGEWAASVAAMGRQSVRVRIGAHHPAERELPFAVTLAVGMPANERMDTLVEKATELGVAAIQPLVCARSVLRLAGERAERKREHWQAVAVAASEQSGRTRVPRIAPVLALQRWLQGLDAGAACRLLLRPGDGATPLRESAALAGDCLGLSGPEGGLTADEEAAALQRGFSAVGLGPRVLRADTAPLALLAWLALQHE